MRLPLILRSFSLTSGLLPMPNRWICGSLMLAQISQGETSHIPRTLSKIARSPYERECI